MELYVLEFFLHGEEYRLYASQREWLEAELENWKGTLEYKHKHYRISRFCVGDGSIPDQALKDRDVS